MDRPHLPGHATIHDASDSKESTCDVGDLVSIPGLGMSPGAGNGNPLQYACLENLQGQRSLMDYSPWGRKDKHTQHSKS